MELLCGPASSGKVRLATDRVLAACREADGAWLIVPTAADVVRARHELADRAGIVLGARVATFHQLARELADEPLAADLVPAGETVLVGRLLAREWPFAGGTPAHAGWVDTARRRIAALRAARAAGDAEVARELELLPAGERDAWLRLLEAHERILGGRRLRDDAWFARRAIQRLRAAANAAEVGMVPLVAHGFDDLATWQVRLLEAAVRLVPVTVSLPFVPGRAVFARRQALVDRLVARGAHLHDGGSAGFDSLVLARLERDLYEPTAEPATGTGDDVTFTDCCGPLQEAEEVVRAVGRALRDGVDPAGIAVLTADPRPARPLLERALHRAGIDATFETTRSLRDTPAGRAVLDLVDAVLDDDPERWIAFARSRVSGIDPVAADAAGMALRLQAANPAHTVRSGWWLDVVGVPQPVRDLVAAARTANAAGALRAVLAALDVAGTGDRRLLRSLDDTVVRVVEACGQRGPDLAELRAALSSIPIPPPAEARAGTVLVAPIARVRTDRFHTVVLFGLHSGGFAAGVDEAEAPLVARELAYTAVTRATSALHVVRQAAASDGRQLAPHPVHAELRRLLPDAPLAVRGLDEVVHRPADLVLGSEVGPASALARSRAGSIDRPVHDPAVDSVAGEAWAAQVGSLETLSVTSLEGYVSCPRRWFIERHLAPREPMGERQVVGSLVHEALATLVPAGVDDADRDTAWSPEAVAAAVDAATHTLPRDAAVRPVDREAARLVTTRVLRDETVLGSRVLVEQPFGGADDPLSGVDIDGTTVVGRIDRIDIDGSHVVVHDYKLGAVTVAGAKLVEAGRLQLPLYWRALEASAAVDPVGALYRPLRGVRPRGILDRERAPAVAGEYRTDRFDHDALEVLVEEGIAEARSAVAGIRAGEVPAAPRGGSCPDWCTLAGTCRVGDQQ